MADSKPVRQPRSEVSGPSGEKRGSTPYSTAKGPKGMRETYKETGKPGDGKR